MPGWTDGASPSLDHIIIYIEAEGEGSGEKIREFLPLCRTTMQILYIFLNRDLVPSALYIAFGIRLDPSLDHNIGGEMQNSPLCIPK